MQAVLAARIDLLEPTAKRLLQGAAVVGRDFWPGPAGLLDGADADDVDATLRVLQDRDLIVSRLSSRISGEREFTFKHVLTRDVAYESLPHRERPAAHARVAAWIEETAGDRVGEFNELLAYHFSTAARAAREGGTDDAESERLRSKAFAYLLGRLERRPATGGAGEGAAPGRRGARVRRRPARTFAGRSPRWGTRATSQATGTPPGTRSARRPRCVAGAVAAPDAGVADLSARACDMPTRWPGSMRTLPPEEEVRACLELGLSYLPEGASEERIKLQMIRATWAFAYPERGFTDEEFEELERAGMDAYETAMQLGLPNLASAALDAAQSVPWLAGPLGTSGRVLARAAKDSCPILTDLDEVGDVTACAAWNYYEVGALSQVLRDWASEGSAVPRVGRSTFRAPFTRLAVRRPFPAGRLGRSDRRTSGRSANSSTSAGTSRRTSPVHAYGAALLIDHARGASPEMERLADGLNPLESVERRAVHRDSVPGSAMLSVVRGRLRTSARAPRRSSGRVARPRRRGARGAVRVGPCGSGVGERLPPSSPSRGRSPSREGCRSWGSSPTGWRDTRCWRPATPPRAVPLLLNARDGFSAHEARYERACTERVLADAFRAWTVPMRRTAASDDARREFERLGVVVPG